MFKKRNSVKAWIIATIGVMAIWTGGASAQQSTEVKVGLLVPLSGPYASHGQVMREGAELAIHDINAEGGIKALDGAKLKLVVMDAGDSTEKTKNAAQRMVAGEPDMVAASGAFISSFTLAMTEVTERAHLPVLTLSFADLITARGFKYVFQDSATAAAQAENALPEIMKLAERASGKRPKSVAIISDTNQSSQDSMKPMRERLFKQYGLKLSFDEIYTPPLTDATPLIQKVRAARPNLLFLLPNSVSDAKLLLDKMSEFGLGEGRVPVITFSNSLVDPSLLKNTSKDLLQGLMAVIANWGVKGEEKLQAEFKEKYGEPYLTQDAISSYGEMWIIKEALEMAKKPDREAVADALRKMDLTTGPAKYFPGGRVKFDQNGRRVGAGFVIVQWQDGKPLTVYPPDVAVSSPIWVKR